MAGSSSEVRQLQSHLVLLPNSCPAMSDALTFACLSSPPLQPIQGMLLQSPDSLEPPSAMSSAMNSPRPGLSRANSLSFTTDVDDNFSGLTLLDALVVLDSHLDLASRNIKKKTYEWKTRAESTAIQVKRQAEEVLNQQRRRRRKATGSAASGAGDGQATDGFTDDDRIDIDRELLRFREKVRMTASAITLA